MSLSTRGLIAVGIASLALHGTADAQAPLNNQWVEFVKDNSHLGPTPTQVSDTNNETDLAWADLDKNGFTDVVVVRKQPFTSAGKRRNMLLMNYNGVLTDVTASLASASDVPGDNGFNTPTNDRDVVIVDVDNDTWLDVVVATTLSDGDPKHIGHPRVYMNLGNSGGNWQGLRFEANRSPQLVHFGTGLPQNPRFCSVAAGDVTGDGFADLYFGDYDSSGAGGQQQGPNEDLNDRLWINDGTGHFLDESQLRMTNQMLLSAFGMAVSIVDFNQDGVMDIMKDTALNPPQYVAISYNNPANPGVFNQFDQVHTSAPYHINTGDLNNDGRIDFIASDDNDDKYRYNTGNDAFGQANWSAALEYGGAGECVNNGCTDDGFGSNNLIADLDGDGWNDTLHADVDVDIGGFTRRLHIYHNPGGTVGSNITLREEQQSTNNNSGWKGVVGLNVPDLQGTHDVAVFDVDNDGDNDMLISRSAGTDLWRNKIIDGPVIVCSTDLGFQGPGTATLSLCGTGFGTGGVNTLSIANAPASSPTYLMVSFPGGINLPYGGGTLVSISNLVPGFPLVFATNGSGEFNFPVAGGGGPFSVVLQALVVNPGLPGGVSITNAIQATFLP